MGSGSGKSVQSDVLTPGELSGATASVYSDSTTNIDISIAAPLSETLGALGAYDKPDSKLNAEDISGIGGSVKVLGVGGGVSLGYDRESGNPQATLDGGLIVGGTANVVFNSWNPMNWSIETNGYVSLETEFKAGAIGVGIGGHIGATYDEGKLSASASNNWGIMGIRAEKTITTKEQVTNTISNTVDKATSFFGSIFGPKTKTTQTGVNCFPGTTPVLTANGERQIRDLKIGDWVWAFDSAANKGRGGLVLKKIVRLFRNVTTEWIKLSWLENGVKKELVATPGHHFLDEFGTFTKLEELVKNGRAKIVSASGELVEASAERIIFSAETAHLFEQAEAQAVVSGNLALKPVAVEGWETYNFEVEDLHTYVANGVRVHNRSVENDFYAFA